MNDQNFHWLQAQNICGGSFGATYSFGKEWKVW